jgi:hypothetical protein
MRLESKLKSYTAARRVVDEVGETTKYLHRIYILTRLTLFLFLESTLHIRIFATPLGDRAHSPTPLEEPALLFEV